jgi:stringent starvation protein B
MNEVDFMSIYTDILKRNKSPIVNIDASIGEVVVPREFIEESGHIQIGISPQAVRNLKVINDIVYCRASFNQEVFCLSFPLASIIDIYEEDDDFS